MIRYFLIFLPVAKSKCLPKISLFDQFNAITYVIFKSSIVTLIIYYQKLTNRITLVANIFVLYYNNNFPSQPPPFFQLFKKAKFAEYFCSFFYLRRCLPIHKTSIIISKYKGIQTGFVIVSLPPAPPVSKLFHNTYRKELHVSAGMSGSVFSTGPLVTE